MPILNPTQIAAATQRYVQLAFVIPNAVANLNTTQITTAITAVDTFMSNTLATNNGLWGASANSGASIGAAVSAAVPGMTVQQETLALICWAEQAGGVN